MALALVIDDEPGIRNLVRRIMQDAGHRIVEAQDGKAGVRAFREHQPELVIIDVFMPEQEGIQTIRQLRAEAPQLKIIAISGGGAYGLDILDGLEYLGADKTLHKPFRKDDLLVLVDEVLT